MFERTPSGQSNRASFFDVDFVCYVEGGGGQNANSPDITSWSRIFSTFRPDIKVRCTPRGGKPILEALAREIIQNGITKSLVAIDSDYDHILGHVMQDRRVIYTYGYSWENDLFAIVNIVGVFYAVSHHNEYDLAPAEFIRKELERLQRELKHAVRADFYALCAGSSVLPRKSPGRIICHDTAANVVYVRKSEVIKLCSKANGETCGRNIRQRQKIYDVHRYCVGHVWALACTYVIRCAYKIFVKNPSFNYDHLRDVALQIYDRNLNISRGSAMYLHYDERLKVI